MARRDEAILEQNEQLIAQILKKQNFNKSFKNAEAIEAKHE